MSDFLLKLVIVAILAILLIPVSVIGSSGGGGYQPKKTNKPRFPPPKQK